MLQLTPHTLLTAYNVEVIVFGMNCVLYAFCAYTLWGQQSMSCRLLLSISTLQFLLCAAQVILHAVFLFLLFTVIADVRAYLQHVNGYLLGSDIIYTINFIITGFVSIWRLYVLYDNVPKACIPAFLFWIAQICASGISIHIFATTTVIATHYNVPNLLLWVFIAAVNLCIALPICVRLCIAQKRTHTTLSRSPYKSVAIVFVECGTLITLCSIAMVILHVCNYPYAVVGVGTATEIAVASQLLIIARHEMLSQSRDIDGPLEQAESRHVDVSMTPTKINTLYSSFPQSGPEA